MYLGTPGIYKMIKIRGTFSSNVKPFNIFDNTYCQGTLLRAFELSVILDDHRAPRVPYKFLGICEYSELAEPLSLLFL